MATDTEIVRAINDVLDDYIARKLNAPQAIKEIARCAILRDVSR